MSDAVLELTLPGGVRICVPDGPNLLTTFILREQGDWFEDEIRFVRRFVTPGMHVIDIGANFGTYCLSMAQCVGPSGSVHAFEPADAPLRLLRRSIAGNRFTQVSLHGVGLSNRTGQARLATSMNPELNSLQGEQEQGETIDLTTLDAVFAKESRRISFVKMDAEGEEERILDGAGSFFASQDPVVMFELKHGAEVNEGLCEAFMRRGFLIHRLVPAIGALVPIPLGEALDGYLLNAFAVRPSSESELIKRGLLVPLRSAMPPEVGQLRVSDCIAGLQTRSWIAAAEPRWEVDASVAGWDDHRRSVALAEQSRSDGLDSLARLACLREARRASHKALGLGVTGSRLFTGARIAFDLGYRGEGVSLLQKVIGLVMDGQDPSPAFKEPFLLPLAEHERLEGLPLRELVSLSTLEAYVWKSAFSAYFTGDSFRPVLERARSLAQHDVRVERTLELLDARRDRRVVSVQVQ